MSDIIKGDFSFAIAQGDTPLGDMLRRIDSYHIRGLLTDEERNALYAEAREQAAGQLPATLDELGKLVELERRLTALEEAVEALQQGGEPPEDPEEPEAPPEYAPGKWYYAGDRVTYLGAAYTCTAPEGAVCVWSPAEYPAYWQLDT